MIEKGIVLKIYADRATVRLFPNFGQAEQTELDTECPPGIRPGNEVRVLLSPGHPLRVKPWEFIASLLIFIGFSLQSRMLTGFLMSHAVLLCCFLKIRAGRAAFTPKILLPS